MLCSRRLPLVLGVILSAHLPASAQPGSFSGLVTASGTGNPLPGVEVSVYSEHGEWLRTIATDGSGRYQLGNLAADTYFARTTNDLGYVDQAYDGVTCVSCVPSYYNGRPIVVSAGADTPGIDFHLSLGGRVAGVVYDAVTNGALPNTQIFVEDATRRFVAGMMTDGAGAFRTPALPAGTYYAYNHPLQGYMKQLYADRSCPNPCTITNGTPIVVTVGSIRGGVDFHLVKGGRVAGRVTNLFTGLGVHSMGVVLADDRGVTRTWGTTDSQGEYLTYEGLTPGTYYAYTYSIEYDYYMGGVPIGAGMIAQKYGGQICGMDCYKEIRTGTPIQVYAGQTTTGIDFAVRPGGRVSGRVSAAPDGTTPIPGRLVWVQDATGQYGAGAVANQFGEYLTFEGLLPGVYYVASTGTYQPDSPEFIGQLYDGKICLLDCDITAGTAVTVTGTETVPNVNFMLSEGARVAGTVTDAVTGNPVSSFSRYAFVSLYDTSGTKVAVGGSSTLTGQYLTIGGVPTGTYYLRTENTAAYVDRVFDGFDCPPTCWPTAGTPLSLTSPAITMDVNFRLTPDRDGDGDGINDTIDLSPAAPSSDFSDVPLTGMTAGSLTDRAGWTLKVIDAGSEGVLASIDGAGGVARITTCPARGAEEVRLDVATEGAAITCGGAGGTSTTVRALMALPVIQVMNPAASLEINVPTGQSVTTGSPTTAAWGNVDPLTARILDGGGGTAGSFELNPGDSIDVSRSASGAIVCAVLNGIVTITVGTEQVTLSAGESHTFAPPIDALVSQFESSLLALTGTGDIRNKGIATSLRATLQNAVTLARDGSATAAANNLRVLERKLQTYSKSGAISPVAYSTLAPIVEALATLL